MLLKQFNRIKSRYNGDRQGEHHDSDDHIDVVLAIARPSVLGRYVVEFRTNFKIDFVKSHIGQTPGYATPNKAA